MFVKDAIMEVKRTQHHLLDEVHRLRGELVAMEARIKEQDRTLTYLEQRSKEVETLPESDPYFVVADPLAALV